MNPKIALVGVPVETVPVQDEMYSICASIPGVTEETRELILKKAAERGISIRDLGEVNTGWCCKPDFHISRMYGVPYPHSFFVHEREMSELERSRKYVLEISRNFDLTVAVGASHLGAIILYDEGDVVARLDYHADFAGWREVVFSYASYMDWVRQNVNRVDVTNFFVRSRGTGILFGKESRDGSVKPGTNHFDIDVDCFSSIFQIQTVYEHNQGSAEATPEMVIEMIRRAKPSKLGIWEYRPCYDSHAKKGIEFIVDAIEAATSKSEPLKHAGDVPYLGSGVRLEV